MSSSNEENSEYFRIIAILKEIGKENLLHVFQSNELTDDVLDCLETEHDLRSELKEEDISKGFAIKFSKTWFCHKKSGTAVGKNDASINKPSISGRAEASDSNEQKKQTKKTEKLASEDHEKISAIPDKVAGAGANVRHKIENLEKASSESEGSKNVNQEQDKATVENVKSDLEISLTKASEEKYKFVETTSQGKSSNVNNNIVLEHDAQKYTPGKCQDNTTPTQQLHPKSNADTEQKGVKPRKMKGCKDSQKKKSSSSTVDRKYFAGTSANVRSKIDNFEEKASRESESSKNVKQEKEEATVASVKSELGTSLTKASEEEHKFVEIKSPGKSNSVNNSIVLERDAQKYSSGKCQDNTTPTQQLHPKSNGDTEQKGVKASKKKVRKDNQKKKSRSSTVDRKYFAGASANEKSKVENLVEKASRESEGSKNVKQEKEEATVKSVKSDLGTSLTKASEEKCKFGKTTSQGKSTDTNNDIFLEHDSQEHIPWKSQDNTPPTQQLHPESNTNTEQQGVKSSKKEARKDNLQEKSSSSTVNRKYCEHLYVAGASANEKSKVENLEEKALRESEGSKNVKQEKEATVESVKSDLGTSLTKASEEKCKFGKTTSQGKSTDTNNDIFLEHDSQEHIPWKSQDNTPPTQQLHLESNTNTEQQGVKSSRKEARKDNLEEKSSSSTVNRKYCELLYVAGASANEKSKVENLEEKASRESEGSKNVKQEKEATVESVKSDLGTSLTKASEEKCKFMETSAQAKSSDVNNNIVLEHDAQEHSSGKCQDNTALTQLHPTSNADTEQKGVKPSKNKPRKDNLEEKSSSSTVNRKYCDRRPFGQPTEKNCYEKGTAFRNVESEEIEFKALTQEKPQKLPWKIMEKARIFVCGILNAGGKGTIYFGVGDTCDKATDFTHGEIIGLEVENLKDEISKAFQSILDDHIRSDAGKMSKGGEMNSIKIHFIPVVLDSNQNTGLYVIEIEVQRDWMFSKDQVYYVEEWSAKKRIDEKKPVEKYCLSDLFSVKKGKDEAYIRTCGATQSVKSSDIRKEIKDPLSEKYKDWQDETNKQQRRMPNQDIFDSQQFSNDVHESLRELNSKENDYILVANKTPPQYRGSNYLAFLQAIPWMAVFDLFDPKTKEDGLYFIFNKTSDSPPVTTKELGDLKQTEEKPTRGTTWILRDQTMHNSKWIHNSKDCLYRAMSGYHEQAPSGRIHCVILVLSKEHLREMADIIDSCVSIIGNEANKCITILSENKDFGFELTKLLQPEVRKDLKNPCSIFGFPIEFLRRSIEEMLGDVAYEDKDATTELPFWNGKYIPILNKRINSLTDLEVYYPKPKLTSSYKEVKAARDNFYKGEVIKQLNLDNQDDIERTLMSALTQRIDRPLKRLSAESNEDTTYVEIVSLIYESGSGATTLGRRILWNQRQRFRCAVVKAISDNTGRQIEDLQRFGYETDQGIIQPVLILVDNFPEHLVYYLRDNLCMRNTKCVLLNTIPMAIQWERKGYGDCLKLEKLDRIEIQRVKKILANVEDKSEQEKDAAVEKIKRERRFIWLGLELFGRHYNKIRKRLSDHIHDIISHNVRDQLKGAYQKILRFCCLLDYYSKGRSIYPHPCIADILYAHDDLNGEDMNQIEKIHDKFGGLLLEDYSEAEGYHGWRPAHFLVGEVVHEEMNFVETAKMLVAHMNSGKAFAKTFLINNTVNVFLKREKMSESSPQNINDTDFILDGISGEDEFDSLEVQTRYSALVMAAMPDESFPSNVFNGLDLLVTLIENVHTTQHKARTLQQIARVFAYEIGMREISEEIEPLVTRISEELQPSDQGLSCSATNGFAFAHQVIDHAIDLQKSFVNHLVTKATFFKVKLRDLYEKAKDYSVRNEDSKKIITEAINTTKKGIQAYDNALEKSPDGYLHAMVGKIQTIVVLLEIFKTHSCFTQSNAGPDESFKNYVTFGNHPDALKEILTEEDLNYFLSLANKVVQHLNEFFGELKFRKRQYDKQEIRKQEVINAKIRAKALRKKFYQVTQRERRNDEIDDTGCKEDVVHDLLYVHDETLYSTWANLPPEVITRIYGILKKSIPEGNVTRDSMLIFARAALEEKIKVDELVQHVELWLKHFPNSVWGHMFNYMIHFPSGTLKPNVQMVKQSADFCKNKGPRTRERYRKSGAEYLLGKGVGLSVILSSHKVSPESVEHKIDFWRSLELYEKLERLRGQKILGRKGVLSYKGIEIMFDNDRYPKESRDDLWFCLGFTLNGPYAYDPIDEDTYKMMEEGFRKRKENGAEERTLKTPWNIQASSTMAQPVSNKIKSQSSDRRIEKSFVSAVKPHSKAETTETRKKEKGNTFYITGEWKRNPKLVRITRSNEGHQLTFTPKFKDQDGKIHNGAFVKGAPKSSECRRHTEKTSVTEKCTFAHSWKRDYVQQTICEFCTKLKRFHCMGDENEHKRYICVLGNYFTESCEIWLPTNE